MPFDVTFYDYSDISIAGMFEKEGFHLDRYTDNYVEFSNYMKDDLKNEVVLERVREDLDLPENTVSSFMQNQLLFIRVSDYKQGCEAAGETGT